ncbi:MAG: hypothetical protein ACKOXV_02110 [Bacteroidota bacterium]
MKKLITQSYIYEIVKPAVPILEILEKLEPKETQTRKYEKSLMTKVFVAEGSAYWIKDNAVFVANMVDEDSIDKNSAKQLDIIHMDDIQLEKIAFIIEKLTEGLGK